MVLFSQYWVFTWPSKSRKHVSARALRLKSGSESTASVLWVLRDALASVLPWLYTHPFALLGGLIAPSSLGIWDTHGCVWPIVTSYTNPTSHPHICSLHGLILNSKSENVAHFRRPAIRHFSFRPCCCYRLPLPVDWKGVDNRTWSVEGSGCPGNHYGSRAESWEPRLDAYIGPVTDLREDTYLLVHQLYYL